MNIIELIEWNFQKFRHKRRKVNRMVCNLIYSHDFPFAKNRITNFKEMFSCLVNHARTFMHVFYIPGISITLFNSLLDERKIFFLFSLEWPLSMLMKSLKSAEAWIWIRVMPVQYVIWKESSGFLLKTTIKYHRVRHWDIAKSGDENF